MVRPGPSLLNIWIHITRAQKTLTEPSRQEASSGLRDPMLWLIMHVLLICHCIYFMKYKYYYYYGSIFKALLTSIFLCAVILMLLYGWASVPLMYPASFAFSIPR